MTHSFPTRLSSDLVDCPEGTVDERRLVRREERRHRCDVLREAETGRAGGVQIDRIDLGRHPRTLRNSLDDARKDAVAANAPWAIIGGDQIGRASCRERVCQYV